MTLAENTVPLRNITPFDEVTLEIADLYAEAENWADGTAIETQQQCDALDVLDKALLDAGKRLEALRIEEKKPLDEQVKAIQARYKPHLERADKARSALNPIRAAWKERERQRKEAEARKAREEAEAVRLEAERLMRESTGNLAARTDAEHMLASAKIAEKDAKKAGKAATTGLGLRTAHEVVVTDLNLAVRHYWSAKRDRFAALVTELAEADARSGIRAIPGITISEVKKAI